jgi:hypothetical protein
VTLQRKRKNVHNVFLNAKNDDDDDDAFWMMMQMNAAMKTHPRFWLRKKHQNCYRTPLSSSGCPIAL